MTEGLNSASLPRRIGRYDVVGLLATGGMAEIFLGKLVGPNEFERPVVIKRILPHLARNAEFVEMFLNEARIVAGIRHANVVHVQELCREGDDDLFLVMEYIEGESVGGVMRRVWTRDETFGYALSAHVIAEACAGLHAAHELTYPDGSPQNVVHRDISPQNLMVTYGGAVKVLDFGIAKTARRVAHTEVGVVKGKSAYMSPEQCRGKELDRRSDVFCLGTLLYELSTSRRLFHRPSDLATMTAITKQPVPRPSEVVPGYPASLEQVCLKALAKSPADRYPTAAAMRRDLVAAIRVLASGEPLEESAARLMHRMFPDRIAEKSEMVRRVVAGSAPSAVVPAEVDPAVELPWLDETTTFHVPAEGRSADYTVQISRDPKSISTTAPSRGRLALAIVTALALGGVAALAARASRHQDKAVIATSSASTPPAAPPSSLATVVLHVESAPPGATVTAGGEEIGTTPLDATLPSGHAPVRVMIAHAGFEPAIQEVVPDANVKVMVTLTPLPTEAAEAEPEPAHPAGSAKLTRPSKRRSAGPAKSGDPFFRFE